MHGKGEMEQLWATLHSFPRALETKFHLPKELLLLALLYPSPGKSNYIYNENQINKVTQLQPEKVKLCSLCRGAHLSPFATEESSFPNSDNQ